MNRRADEHLSLDDIDAWLAGQTGAAEQAHLETCGDCRDLAHTERMLARQLAALPAFAPSTMFADQVMASVAIPDPFAIRSLQTARRRLFTTPRALAAAAMVAVVLVASMTGSIVWTLSHRDVLANAGSWLSSQAGQWLWTGLQGVVSTVIEQPWYGGVRDALESPVRLALVSGVASLTYLSGVVALRKLMAVPSGPVTHANA